MNNFLDLLNTFLQEERKAKGINCKSFFVEHKQVIPNSNFKAIKDYIVTINIVKQDKNPIILCKYKHTFNSGQTTQEEVYRKLSEEIALNLLRFMHSFNWEKILNGNYESPIE